MASRKGPDSMARAKDFLGLLGNRAALDLNSEPVDEEGSMMGQVYDPYPVTTTLSLGPPGVTTLSPGPRPVPVLARGPPPPVSVGLGRGPVMNARPSSSGHPLPYPGQPQTIPFMDGMHHDQVYKATVEKEELKLDLIRFHNMLNAVQLRANQLARENESLKKTLQEVSALLR